MLLENGGRYHQSNCLLYTIYYSLWDNVAVSFKIVLFSDQVFLMASIVPIPAAAGCPQGPKKCHWGAPVVRALIPAYVVPFTVRPSTLLAKSGSLSTIPAVRWCVIELQMFSSNLRSSSDSHVVTIWKGPNTSVVTKSIFGRILFSGTNTAVGSKLP